MMWRIITVQKTKFLDIILILFIANNLQTYCHKKCMLCGVKLVDLSYNEVSAAQIFKSLCSVLLLIMCLFVYFPWPLYYLCFCDLLLLVACLFDIVIQFCLHSETNNLMHAQFVQDALPRFTCCTNMSQTMTENGLYDVWIC